MSQRITVTVFCDEKVSPECAREYQESGAQLQELEYIGMRMYQQEWHRGYRPLEGGDVHWDVCGPCWAVLAARRQTPESATP